MTQARPIVRPNSRIWLLTAFLLIIAGFALGNVVALVTTGKIQQENRAIAQNALVSIQAVSRIVHDIDQQRLLLDDHIFEQATPARERIEQKLAAVEADMVKEAGVYEPLTTFPGEHAIWEHLWHDAVQLRQPVQNILLLSRRNSDAEAMAVMRTIEKNFDEINEDANKLLEVNQRAAEHSRLETQRLQRKAQLTLGAITLGGTLLSLFLAWSVLRVVKRQDDEIAQTASLLEQRNRELDAFAGRVAHDLRGPLNAINLSIFKIAKSGAGEETIQALRRGIGRMAALIDDLLALSRVDGAAREASARADMISQTVEDELTPRVISMHGTLRLALEPATIRVSETLLRQVLLNLGENAVKYCRAGVPLQVEILGRAIGSWYEIRISDNGTGISPEETEHIFEPFFRAPRVRSMPGTGLGLSIVKRIVDASGGTIEVVSEIERGTTFLLRLPLVPLEHQQAG